MIRKVVVAPQANSKYRILKKTANNKTVYILEFANSSKLDSLVKYKEVPGRFAFDTLEEAKETINIFKILLQESTETVYEE